jgi:hypothetical protein
MTLVAALIFGLLSGFAVRGARRAVIAALVPWLAVLALQSALLASGHGNNPTSTIKDAGYWTVQAVGLALCLSIAAFVASRRARRTKHRQDTTVAIGL